MASHLACLGAGGGAGGGFIQGAPDNAIAHGTNYSNWLIDALGTTVDSAGIHLRNNGTIEFARISIAGLAASTDYWLKLTISSKGATAGNLRLQIAGTDGSNIASVNEVALNYDFPTAVPFTKYVRFRTDASAGPHLMPFRNAASVDNTDASLLHITECTVYPIPTRSAAKIAILGDRESGFVQAQSDAVDVALLSAAADTVNLVSPGDLSDGLPTYANSVDVTPNFLKTTIVGRGGNIYPAAGNWDYSGGIAAWETYFGITAGQSNRYRKVALGQCDFFFYDSNAANTDNSQVDVASAKAAVMGQWLLTQLAASTARWKIVVVHHPMYSSSTHHLGPSNTAGWSAAFKSMQWDWAALGVSFVLNSHDHVNEAMLVNGTMHLCYAMGGGTANAFGTLIPESVYAENPSTSGFVKLHDSTNDLVIEMFSTATAIPQLKWRWKITRY